MPEPTAELLTRAATALAVLGAVSLAVPVARAIAARQRGAVLATPPDPQLATGRATLLYFHGDGCADCVVQERELDLLLTAHPEVAIRADHAPSQLSARFRVLTVPTTVVLDGAGRAHAVNYGLTARSRLEDQLREAASPSQGAATA